MIKVKRGMTIDEMQVIHNAIWKKIIKVKNVNAWTKDPFVKSLGFNLSNACAACEYVKLNKKSSDDDTISLCERLCPLDWGTFREDSSKTPCERYGSSYAEWKKTNSIENALEVLTTPLRKFPVSNVEEPKMPSIPEVHLKTRIRKRGNKGYILEVSASNKWLVLLVFKDDGEVRFIPNGMPDQNGDARGDGIGSNRILFPSVSNYIYNFDIASIEKQTISLRIGGEMKYKVILNWHGELKTYYTYASTKMEALTISIYKMAEELDRASYHVRAYILAEGKSRFTVEKLKEKETEDE